MPLQHISTLRTSKNRLLIYYVGYITSPRYGGCVRLTTSLFENTLYVGGQVSADAPAPRRRERTGHCGLARSTISADCSCNWRVPADHKTRNNKQNNFY